MLKTPIPTSLGHYASQILNSLFLSSIYVPILYVSGYTTLTSAILSCHLSSFQPAELEQQQQKQAKSAAGAGGLMTAEGRGGLCDKTKKPRAKFRCSVCTPKPGTKEGWAEYRVTYRPSKENQLFCKGCFDEVHYVGCGLKFDKEHFRAGAVLCVHCEKELAVRKETSGEGDEFCVPCWDITHRYPRITETFPPPNKHTHTQINTKCPPSSLLLL